MYIYSYIFLKKIKFYLLHSLNRYQFGLETSPYNDFVKNKFLDFYLRYKRIDINIKFINNKKSGAIIRQIYFFK